MILRQPKHFIMKTKIYKKNPWITLGCLIAFAIVFLNYSTGFSQCIMPTQYGSATVPAPGAPPVSISTCNFQTEYSPLSGAVAGYTYTCENVTAGGDITMTLYDPITHTFIDVNAKKSINPPYGLQPFQKTSAESAMPVFLMNFR